MSTPRLYSDLARLWPLVSPPADYAEEAAFYRECFAARGVPDGATLLHLGSGGGSLDWQLQGHYRITGVDLSPEMIAVARGVNPAVEYHLGNMCEVRLGRRFDAVLVHDGIAYLQTLDELVAVYQTAAAHLAPGGVLLSVTEHLRERHVQHNVDAETHEDGDRSLTLIQVDFDADPTDRLAESIFIYVIRDGAATHVEVDTHVIGLRTLGELVAAAGAAGFQTEVVYLPEAIVPDEPPYPLILGRLGEG